MHPELGRDIGDAQPLIPAGLALLWQLGSRKMNETRKTVANSNVKR